MVVISVAGWIAVLVEEQQRDLADRPDNVQTAFEDGFYLVTSGAILSICAIVANVVKYVYKNTCYYEKIASHLCKICS